MSAVKKAEQRILDSAKTKTYKGVVGNKEFSAAIVDLALAGVVDQSRIRCVNGAGGTGALMILMHVLGRARPKGAHLPLRSELAEPLAAGRERQPRGRTPIPTSIPRPAR